MRNERQEEAQPVVTEKPYLGHDKEAQHLAELGTYSLIGDYKSEKAFREELSQLQANPAHLKEVVADLQKINYTKDGLPVNASVEKDGSGNITALRFDSSKELEVKVGENEQKYEECINDRIVQPHYASGVIHASEEQIVQQAKMAKESCSYLDTPAASPKEIPDSYKVELPVKD